MRSTVNIHDSMANKQVPNIRRLRCSLAAAAVLSAIVAADNASCVDALRNSQLNATQLLEEDGSKNGTFLKRVDGSKKTVLKRVGLHSDVRGHFPIPTPGVNATPMGIGESSSSPSDGVFIVPGEGAEWAPQLAGQGQQGGHLLGRRYPEIPDEDVSGWQMLMAVGGGTGAHVGASGNPTLEREIILRMRYQDKAVMCLLLLAYLGALLFSASLAYREACNESRVSFYADPRYHDLSIEGNDVEEFLRVFDQPPKDVHLQITGMLPPRQGHPSWIENQWRVAFSFALDLSSWVVREGAPLPSLVPPTTIEAEEGEQENRAEPVMSATEAQAIASASFGPNGNRPAPRSRRNPLGYEYYDEEEEAAWNQHQRSLQEGDIEKLRNILTTCGNDLAMVSIQQDVAWKGWEELATNIKTKIRQAGFPGKIHVTQSTRQPVDVHQNKAWANFMHGRTTKVLFALSVIGWLVYHPYMYIRCWTLSLKSHYRVQVPIDTFWPLVEDKLNAEGFDSRYPEASGRAA